MIRKGSMRTRVSRVIEPEEFKDLTAQQLFEVIEKELWQDEAKVTGDYPHPKNAEFLERLIYTCPKCGLAPFESSGDIVRCTKCGLQVRHLSTKELEGIGEAFPHRFVAQWYEAQNQLVNSLDLQAMCLEPVFRDTAALSLVHVYKNKTLLTKQAAVCLYGDRITVDDREFPFSRVSAVTVLGKNKLNIYDGQEVFQLKGSKRFNALKYVNFFHRYKNITKGDGNGQFLGL